MSQSAFPGSTHLQTGMTLRDYFAAKAMQAMVAAIMGPEVTPDDVEEAWAELPGAAYKIADAMLSERAK